MPLYRWPDSEIVQIESRLSPAGKRQAVVRLQDAGRMPALRELLAAQGLASFVDAAEAPSLILPEFPKDDGLIASLRQAQWVRGEPQTLETPQDRKEREAKPASFLDKHPTLIASVLFDIGSVSWVCSSIAKSRHNEHGQFTRWDFAEMLVGISLGLGNLMLTIFGKDRKHAPMLTFAEKLEEHLKKGGVELPRAEHVNPESLKNSGALSSIETFLSENIISVLSASKVVGGLATFYAATKPTNRVEKKMAAGLLMATSWLATAMLDDPHKPPYRLRDATPEEEQGSLERLGKWFKENPRARVASLAATPINMLKLWGAFDERQRNYKAVDAAKQVLDASPADEALQLAYQRAENRKHDYIWNVISYSTFLVGTAAFAKSGKSGVKIGDFAEFEKEMLVVSANILANVPEKARHVALMQTADYIASIEGVTESRDEIMQGIRAKIGQLQDLSADTGIAR